MSIQGTHCAWHSAITITCSQQYWEMAKGDDMASLLPLPHLCSSQAISKGPGQKERGLAR